VASRPSRRPIRKLAVMLQDALSRGSQVRLT
jgi:hypothetical protein